MWQTIKDKTKQFWEGTKRVAKKTWKWVVGIFVGMALAATLNLITPPDPPVDTPTSTNIIIYFE